jgi:predicted nucleic acid-binding protein
MAETRRSAGLAPWVSSVASAPRIRPLVPVVVLAQAWRGGPQHQISRVLKGCDVLPDDEATGRAAGVAGAASGTADVVDAIVIVTAVRHQAPVVTSDPGDLTRIADSLGVKIRLFPI